VMVGGNIVGQTRILTTAIAIKTGRSEFGLAIVLAMVLLALRQCRFELCRARQTSKPVRHLSARAFLGARSAALISRATGDSSRPKRCSLVSGMGRRVFCELMAICRPQYRFGQVSSRTARRSSTPRAPPARRA